MIAEALEDRRLLTAARLGDFVWNDLNENGLQDAGEPGVAGVVVEAFGSQNGFQGDADDVSRAMAVTDATGHYTLDFDAVHAEDVYVYLQVRVPRDYTFTTRDAGGDDTRDSDVYEGGTTDMFVLGVGDDDPTFDAGLQGSPPAFGFALHTEAEAFGTATDAAGNVYVAGDFAGSVDFDPGPGLTALAATGLDAFVAKYTAAGALLWVRVAGSWGSDQGKSVAVGQDGSVYVLGYFSDTVDFAPGPATYTLTSAGGPDVFLWKLDADGNFMWARR